MLEWVSNKLSTDPGEYYTFMSLLAAGKVEAFRDRLQELLNRSTSFYQTGVQSAALFYSGFMLGFLSILSSAYVIESERESGLGRPDVVLIPEEKLKSYEDHWLYSPSRWSVTKWPQDAE